MSYTDCMSTTVNDDTGYVDPRVLRTRALVARTAAELILEAGPAAVGVEAVASRARVARSTVYRHFPLHDDLLVAALDILLPRAADALPDGPIERRLRHVTGRFAEHLATPAVRAALPALLAVAVSRDQGPQERLARDHRDPLLAVVGEGVERGELSASTDVALAVTELLGPLLFMGVVLATTPSTAELEALVGSFMRAHAPAG